MGVGDVQRGESTGSQEIKTPFWQSTLNQLFVTKKQRAVFHRSKQRKGSYLIIQGRPLAVSLPTLDKNGE